MFSSLWVVSKNEYIVQLKYNPSGHIFAIQNERFHCADVCTLFCIWLQNNDVHQDWTVACILFILLRRMNASARLFSACVCVCLVRFRRSANNHHASARSNAIVRLFHAHYTKFSCRRACESKNHHLMPVTQWRHKDDDRRTRSEGHWKEEDLILADHAGNIMCYTAGKHNTQEISEK